MADQLKNIMIGIFVIAALSIVIFIMMFLHPNIGNEARTLYVRFANIDKVTLGTRVTFGGKPVGEVVEISEIPDVDFERTAYNGYVYSYQLKLVIDSGIFVYITDDISLRTSGLLGERSIAITPIPVNKGEKLVLVTDQILYATETGSVEETLKEFKELADKFETVLDDIHNAFMDIRDSELIESLGEAAKNINDITASLNKPEDWSKTLTNIREISDRAVASWDKVDDALTNIVDASSGANNVMVKINQGEGSVGKIIVRDDLYLRMSSLLSKAEVVLNDVNHYGILFHQDKGWQRLRARRLNLLQKLCSPQEFRNFFNDEMDGITSSLERVYFVIDETECPCFDLWQNPQYSKVYAEILRRVETLQESLKMYNQQVVDHEVRMTEFDENWCQ
jgi:phospholipid/cholesterol/gamma-HCH transport system substrate-binding protein